MCRDTHSPTGSEALRTRLFGSLIGLARATEGNDHLLTPATAEVVCEGLRATVPDAVLDSPALLALLDRVDAEKRKLVPSCYLCASPCGRTDAYDLQRLQKAPEDIREIKLRLLSGLPSIAAGPDGTDHAKFLYLALFAIGMEDWTQEELLPILAQMDQKN